jgi:hypothetical protein
LFLSPVDVPGAEIVFVGAVAIFQFFLHGVRSASWMSNSARSETGGALCSPSRVDQSGSENRAFPRCSSHRARGSSVDGAIRSARPVNGCQNVAF